MKLKQGQSAPAFAAQDVFGNTIDLKDYAGHKLMISFYRFSSCPFCNLRVQQILTRFDAFEERGLISQGRLCEVGYEDLERDPAGVVGSVYESLGLPGFEDVRPRLVGYLDSIAGYRKNRLDDLPEPLRLRIAGEWSRSFDEWGYER